jgi:hypothetical protein
MDYLDKESILDLMRERTGIESLSEIELLPDECAEDIALCQELLELAELYAVDDDEGFELALQSTDRDVQKAWKEVIDSI